MRNFEIISDRTMVNVLGGIKGDVVVDSDGEKWVDNGDGSYTNQDTGEVIQ